jgi:hypothetical protein
VASVLQEFTSPDTLLDFLSASFDNNVFLSRDAQIVDPCELANGECYGCLHPGKGWFPESEEQEKEEQVQN